MGLPISVCLGITAGAVIPTLFFVVEYRIESVAKRAAMATGSKRWMTFTPAKKIRNPHSGEIEDGVGEVDFDPRHGHYMKCGEVLITLASASLIFIPSLKFTTVHTWLGFAMVLLGFTVVYALCFMGLLTYFYEMFLFDPDSQTITRSALIFGLGFGALTCFAVAYFVLSLIVGSALSHGTFYNATH